MNSKTKLFSLSLTLFLILVHSLSFAQTFQYSFLSHNFNVTLDPLSASNQNQTTPIPYYTLFIETGDGRFYKNDPMHYLGEGLNATPPYNIPYNFPIPSGSEALLKLIGHYDTIKPPRSLFTYRPFYNSSSNQLPIQDELHGNRIGFNYSDPVVIPKDTMTLVLTYKPDKPTTYLVAFFYNDNTPTGERVFNEITDPNQAYTFSYYATGGSPDTRQVKAIRVRDETVFIAPTGIPPQISADVSAAKGNFNSAIYFMVPSSTVTKEKNIFISMAALKENQFGTTTKIKAVLFKYDSLGIINPIFPVADTLDIGQFATDPNGIRTSPDCLTDFRDGPFSKPIQYEINFQNDGKRDSKNIEVTVWVPQGIEFPASGLLNVHSTISRKAILFVKEGTTPSKSPNTYKLVTSGVQRKIIFSMPNINLPGTSEVVNRRDVLLRHGIISFTLNTISKKSTFPNNTIPDCMYSDVSIVFSTDRGGEIISNPPVIGYDLIRKNCYSAIPPCKRTYTAVVPSRTQ